MNNVYRKDGWVKTTLGPAVPGAQIFVCSQPANTASAPPSPLVTVYSDPGGLVPITQPIISDGFGHYNYYVAPGLYTEVIAYGGTIQQVYPDQSIGNVGTSGSGSSIVFSTNGTPNYNQLTQNLVQGVGVVLVTDNLGNTTITSSNPTPVTLPVFKTNGVVNSSQAQLNLGAGVGMSLTEIAGNVTLTNTQPLASTLQFSIPDWVNMVGTSGSSQWMESPSNGTYIWKVVGVNTGGSGALCSVVQPTTTVAEYTKATVQQTGVNQYFAFAGSSFLGTYLGFVKTFKTNISVFSTTSVRHWVGMSNKLSGGLGTIFEANNPVADIVGFRYVAGTDAHWVAYCSTDDTHYTTLDTGVTPDITGALHSFSFAKVQGIPGTVNFLIDGVSVGSISTNVPAGTVLMAPLAYVEGLTNVSPSIGINMFYAEYFQ